MEHGPRRLWSGIESFLSLERNVLVISATGLLTNFGAQAFQPFIPLYLKTLKATVPEIGLVYVGIAIAANLSVFGGLLADKIGRKVTIVVGGSVGFGLFLGLLGVNTWIVALLVLFASYFFATLVQPAVTSTLAESVDVKDRGNAFGTFWFLVYLGLAAGSLVGGYLPNPGRFELNIFVIGIVGIGAALARSIFLRETLPPEARSNRTNRREGLFVAHMSRNVWLVMTALLLFNFSSGLGQPLYALFSIEQLQLSQGEFAVMIGTAYLASMLGAFGAGRASKRLGVRRMMILAVIFSGLLLIPWIYASSSYLAIGVYAVSGFFVQFFFVGNQALMSNITKTEERSSIIGFITTIAGLGGIAAPYIGSELWTLIDPRTPFLISILLSGLVAIPLAIVSEAPAEPTPTFQPTQAEVTFQRWFCRYCGQEIDLGARHCHYCGRNLE
jgi:DHA1 family quinolone resistance protein-like MFS transporter